MYVIKKQDLVKVLASKVSMSQDVTTKLLWAFIEIITAELKNGGEVGITGFGTFKVSKRSAREWINPKTLAKIKIPAMNSPSFRAGLTLKNAVR